MTKYAETFDFRWKMVYNGIKLSVLEGMLMKRIAMIAGRYVGSIFLMGIGGAASGA